MGKGKKKKKAKKSSLTLLTCGFDFWGDSDSDNSDSGKPDNEQNPSNRQNFGNNENSEESLHSACNPPMIRPATQFPVQYRKNPYLNPEEQENIQKAVEKGGVAIGTHTYLDMDVLPTVLDTDKTGAAIVVNNAPKDDVKDLGDSTCLSTPEVIKELQKRLEEPRPALQREKLKQARDNIEDFSDNSQLQQERAIESDRIRKERKAIGKKTVRTRNSKVSELSGKPMDSPEVHHIDRVADQPEKVSDPDNLVVLDASEHKDFHHSEFPPTAEGYKRYREEYQRRQKTEDVK